MSPSDQPTVTIAIAAYNCAETIGATLESCLAQSAASVEVLVVDDGSTDSTAAVLARFVPRIRVVRQPNGGLAKARNTGMREAAGRYIAWMDADDLCHPDRLLLQGQVLDTCPDVALVSSNFSAFRTQGNDEDPAHLCAYYKAPQRLGGLPKIYPQRGSLEPAPSATTRLPVEVRRGKVYPTLLEGNFVHPPTVMFRRSLLTAAGECDASLRYSSDYDFFIRLSRLGEFAFIDAPLLRYRLSETQMSKAAVGGTMQMETIAILDRVRATDPAIHSQCRPLFERRYAQSYVSAARAIGAADKLRGFSLLWRGLRYGAHPRDVVRTAARIVVPSRLLPAPRP